MSDTFASLLRRYRVAANISQQALAELASISVVSVGAYEQGARRAPHAATVSLLADALRLDGPDRARFEAVAKRKGTLRARPVADRQSGESGLERSPRHNLQPETSSFIGRQAEIDDLLAIFGRSRLVTLTGTGGIGKTRLAAELAETIVQADRRDVWFIDLSELNDGAYVVSAIAAVLRRAFPLIEGTDESLIAALNQERCLLILDSCEQVIAEAARIAASVLKSCPHVAVVATSREPLRVGGETVYRLAPLAVPSSDVGDEMAKTYASVALFIERSASSAPTLSLTGKHTASIVDICRRLDGLPLAIELAAARLPTLGLSALRTRLNDRFIVNPIRRDLPVRQQTMHAAIAWSFDLLSEQERAVLSRLAVFAGGATLAAAEIVCGDAEVDARHVAGLLASLVDKSFLTCQLELEPARYVLFDSIREYAIEQLAATGKRTEILRRHATWLTASANAIILSTDERILLDQHGPEMSNIRAAIHWALDQEREDDVVLAGIIIGGFRVLWFMQGLASELHGLITAALAKISAERYPAVVGQLFRALIRTAKGKELAAAMAAASLHFESCADYRGLCLVYRLQAIELRLEGDITDSNTLLMKAQTCLELARLEHSEHLILSSLLLLERAGNQSALHLTSDARVTLDQARRLAGNHNSVLMHIAMVEIQNEIRAGDLARAFAVGQAALELARQPPWNPRALHILLGDLSAVCMLLDDLDVAEAYAKESLQMMRAEDESLYVTIQHFAAIAAKRGNGIVAARLFGFVEAWRQSRGYSTQYLAEYTNSICTSKLPELLSPHDLMKAQTAGSQLTLDQVITEALSS